MDKVAVHIGRAVLAFVFTMFFTALAIGVVMTVSDIWHAVWPEYRKYVISVVGGVCFWPAWKLANSDD